MSKTFDQGREEVARLCEYFATNREEFTTPGVKEAHIRQTLIDPLFEALGWDMRNLARAAPQYREVIPEDSLDVEGTPQSPDYTFRVGTLPKFYGEAKKCVDRLYTHSGHACQVRSYGWNKKLPLCVLTNFAEFAAYDCTVKPKKTDKASRCRIIYVPCEEYVQRWREMWDLFSREAVWGGKFDAYADLKRKRGTSEVDVEFLKLLEDYRESLARNIALNNPNLSSEDLNVAVQRTIDRVVFLRMAEDRGLEPYPQLLNLSKRTGIYTSFMRDLCRKADEKYNSGLFHFHEEPGVSEPPDRITPKLTIDDKAFRPILQKLYFEYDSPYHFGILPVEILGTVYERFLGRVIRLTVGHQAKVEEKPEVRKAGGVYYTPSYIVDYIVSETVGRQVVGKSPVELADGKNKAPFRVLDMACGSGSFLLGAYQFLLDHCLKWYVYNNPRSHKKAVYNGARSGQWRLTIEEKKRILTTHLFGVDLDPQAVEVSKLSLLLKVLEGENDQSVIRQRELFHKRALPNLVDNVKCGNSLIGPDYFTGTLVTDADQLKHVNPFDWKARFPDAMKAGGFDCVIGNPPYIRIQTMRDNHSQEVEFLGREYKAAIQGNYDIYVLFAERGLRLLNKTGHLGFILPNKFFRTDYGEGLRQLLAQHGAVERIVDFGHNQVFAATTYTCLLFLANGGTKTYQYAESLASCEALQRLRFSTRHSKALSGKPWTFENAKTAAVFAKMAKGTKHLLDLPVAMSRGSSTGDDEVFVFERGTLDIENGIVKQPLFASDFGRYTFAPAKKWSIIFPYVRDGAGYRLLTERELKRQFPRACAFLQKHQRALKERRQFKEWYGYSAPRNLTLHDQAHIAVPLLANRGECALIPHGMRGQLCPMASGGFTVTLSNNCRMKPEYVLGLLNSRLLFWRLRGMSNVFRGGWITCTKQYFSKLPIRVIDFSDKRDHMRHDRMVKLVDSMLSLHKHLAAANSEAQKTVVQRQIEATDAEIDRLVYDLYGLTDEEIALVEETARR